MDSSTSWVLILSSLRLFTSCTLLQAQRGIPLSHDAIVDHAADIAQKEIGESWIQNFKRRHPNLRVRWTSSLEECRAKSLTPEVVCKSEYCLPFSFQ